MSLFIKSYYNLLYRKNKKSLIIMNHKIKIEKKIKLTNKNIYFLKKSMHVLFFSVLMSIMTNKNVKINASTD
jgi:hypothetical protein